jgi:hypothetical protein
MQGRAFSDRERIEWVLGSATPGVLTLVFEQEARRSGGKNLFFSLSP